MKKLLFAIALFFLLGGISTATISKTFDVRTASEVEAADLDNHLKGMLAGKGRHFKEAERKYNVNAAFLAAIAIYESANGTSSRARNKKNCFGLRGCTFKSIEECIDYTAMIIASETGHYYGKNKYTIDKIGKTYAPTWHHPNNRHWVSSVISIMGKITTK